MLHLRRALAAVAVGVVVVSPLGCGGGSTAGSAGPASTLPGTPGHFDNGALSFDYPTDWAVIAGTDNGAEGVMDVLAVLGTGSWSENCQFAGDSEHSSMNCGVRPYSWASACQNASKRPRGGTWPFARRVSAAIA